MNAKLQRLLTVKEDLERGDYKHIMQMAKVGQTTCLSALNPEQFNSDSLRHLRVLVAAEKLAELNRNKKELSKQSIEVDFGGQLSA